ncbi:DUF3509 domain-containing protein [Pseudomonas sp. GM17]|nr:DUF3509 domain-containing protein [Pseudomonas sp. GM17]WIE48928.1 DUF3509 domain-containing protein [Pseudomonas sp. GM17]
MAIHANCTDTQTAIFYNDMIYNDFYKNRGWHNRCTYHSRFAIQEPMELIDMSLIQEKFASLFSNYEVTTQPRPDGGILLTLRNSEGKQLKRSISYAQLHAGDQLSWVISALRRDLAEQASELPQISLLQSQNRFALPSYHSL